jgi:hypothetical protein
MEIKQFANDLDAIETFVFKTPLSSGTSIFESFEERFDVKRDHEDFLYIPGKRADAVLLVAHVDTVWQHHRGNFFGPPQIEIEDGIARSKTKYVGIGADDRAGVAMIWQLADLGHSILLTDKEEIGMIGARTAMKLIGNELQNHQFMVSFDRMGYTDFKCYDVGTDEFRDYMMKSLSGFKEPDRRSYSDIVTLARDICAVNLSTCYFEEHTQFESLDMEGWKLNLDTYRKWLSQPLQKFERTI